MPPSATRESSLISLKLAPSGRIFPSREDVFAVPIDSRTAERIEAAFADGNTEEPELLSTRDVLEFATIEGARVCGLEERTGSLTPGKQADVVVVRCDESNTWPVIDPVSTVVHQADTRNVDLVLVAGEFLKRNGRLVHGDLRRARDDAAAFARPSAAAHDHPAALGPHTRGPECEDRRPNRMKRAASMSPNRCLTSPKGGEHK